MTHQEMIFNQMLQNQLRPQRRVINITNEVIIGPPPYEKQKEQQMIEEKKKEKNENNNQ